jgi:hypothetical protein
MLSELGESMNEGRRHGPKKEEQVLSPSVSRLDGLLLAHAGVALPDPVVLDAVRDLGMGLVLRAGDGTSKAINTVRRTHPTIPVLVEHRTVEGDEQLRLDATEPLDDQETLGVAALMGPATLVTPGDASGLREVLALAGDLGQAGLPSLRLPTPWLTGRHLGLLLKALDRAPYGAVVNLVHAGNPCDVAGVVDGLARLSSAHPGVVLLRQDVSGLGGFSHGARATGIGLSSTTRHWSDGGGFRVADQSPRVLVDFLLNYFMGSFLADAFADLQPLCELACCESHPLTRFLEPEHRPEAAVHSLHVLHDLHEQILSTPIDQRAQWWTDLAATAVACHTELTAELRVDFSAPPFLRAWAARGQRQRVGA